MRDNDGRVSWQSGTAATEEDCLLGLEHHFFGNSAASVRLGNRNAQSCGVCGQRILLIISVSTAIRQSKMTAMTRNKYVCEMADRILFVGVTEQSSLYPYKNEYRNKLEKSI